MGIFDNLAWQLSQKAAQKTRIPAKYAKNLPYVKRILNGDIQGGIGQAINERFGLATPLTGFGEDWGTIDQASPLLGGINLTRAREIFEECRATDYAKKNLWALSIYDLKQDDKLNASGARINLFATDVSHGQYTLTGNSTRIGSGHFDVPENGQAVEIRITTMDDTTGTVKRWFKDRYLRAAHPDGTHGIPFEYLMVCEIVHAYIDDAEQQSDAYIDRVLCRVNAIETDLSRREDAMQELQITLSEHDSFIPI